MEARSLIIGLVAVVAAFAATFGLAKATSSPTTPASAGAEIIDVTAPTAIAGIEAGGAMPALKTEAKRERKAVAKRSPASKRPAPGGAPSKLSTPAPSAPKPSAPAPSTPAPRKQAPAPTKPEPPPVTGDQID